MNPTIAAQPFTHVKGGSGRGKSLPQRYQL